MAKILGIGGVFFKSADPKRLRDWYVNHLGLTLESYGSCNFQPDAMPAGSCTVWHVFDADTKYYGPSMKEFMLNFIVDDVDGMLERARAGGAQIVGEIADYDYGRFGHFVDPDGNKIELWMPK